MREIKFRGFAMNLVNPRWVYGFYAKIPSNGGMGSFIFDSDEWVEVIGGSVGEYINRKDVYDNEVFEGDVVEWGLTKKFREVVGFDVESQKIRPFVGFSSRVIGNNYENPELLEEAECDSSK